MHLQFVKLSLLFFLLNLVLVSCKQTPPSTSSTPPQTIRKNSDRNLAAKGPYNPSSTRIMDLVHTNLDLSFDWEKQHVNGIAKLKLKPYFYPQDSLILDAKGFDIHSVKLLEENSSKDLKYSYNNAKIRIILDRVYTRNDTFLIEIDYTAKPNELPVGGSEAINADKGLYFINPDGSDSLKPRQIWTQGETEANSKWFPTIDTPNEKCTQEMYITVDTAFTVLSNGEFVYSIENGDGTKTDYWKMDLPHAPYLFMMAIGNYTVINDFWNGKEVNYYVEPEFKEYAKAVFGNTPEMLSFFSEKLDYPYPWNKYSQVVVRDFVSGAMENTTATIFMEALQIDDREILDVNWDYIIAHELFHHWFGDLVTCESWANLPLNESFANYSEYLWSEYKYGVDEADFHGEKELIEYLDESRTKQEPLIRYHYLDKEDMFDRHSYNKGGRILHMLRNLVGDEAFFKALGGYLKSHQFSTVEIHDLRLEFEKVTGRDLNWFFNQWFLSPGHLKLKAEHTYNNGKVILKLVQMQDTAFAPLYTIPVKVAIYKNGVPDYITLNLHSIQQEFQIESAIKPDLVLLDPEFVLVAEIEHEKSLQELAFQYRNAERYFARKSALEALLVANSSKEPQTESYNDPIFRQIIVEALNDKFWAIRDYALNLFFQFPIDPAPFVDSVEKLALNDSKPEVRANAIYFLSRFYNNTYIDVYKKGLSEKPYSIVAAALSSYLKTGDTTLAVAFPEFENLNNLDISLALANHYVSNGVQGKYPWFKDKMILNKSKPRAIYNLLYFFGEYLSQLNELEKEDARKILSDIKENNKYEVIRSLSDKYLQNLN